MQSPTLPSSAAPWRVLIASANPLFRAGLHKAYSAHWQGRADVIAMTASLQETLEALETYRPDLVIVDYDDQEMNRAEFLSRFVAGDNPMQVVLVSLGAAETVIVYDRRQLTADEAETWLCHPWDGITRRGE